MDANVVLIVSALVAGITKVSEQAVQDAYNALKGLIKRKFEGNKKVEGALEGLEADAETWRKPLEAALDEVDAGKDDELVAAARRLKTEFENVAGMGTQVGGTGNIQQNIGQMSGGTVIGQQTNRSDNRDE